MRRSARARGSRCNSSRAARRCWARGCKLLPLQSAPGISCGMFILAALMPLLTPIDLRCEYHTNPPAIESNNPRLSWLLDSADPSVGAQSQSAYQILVATTKNNLTESAADLWNTGKVPSNETNQIPY